MDVDAFYLWVFECAKNGAQTKTIKTMLRLVVDKQCSGKKVADKVVADALTRAKEEDSSELRDFLQDTLECQEVFFLKFAMERIVADHESTVPFENQSPREFARYLLEQSHLFPAEMFRKHGFDGHLYCTTGSEALIRFLKKHCGFRTGTARPLMKYIDGYPDTPAPPKKHIRARFGLLWTL